MRISRWSLVLVVALLSGVQADTPAPSAQSAAHSEPFADFEFLPGPAYHSGRVFRLSQQYPAAMPQEGIPEFFKIDFKTNWREYLMAAREYCFAGNISPDGDLENDFQVAEQDPPRWFHMPWQTYGPLGREGVHGVTQEAPVQPRQLAWTQVYDGGQTCAVGFYNTFGGYTIGQIWKDHNNPDLSKGPFPEGAVVFKLLFVDVPTDQVPFLVNPVQWTAFVPPLYTSPPNTDANELPPTHLGWNGRLNGPVDNPMSSCMSCHATGEYPVLSALSPLFQEVSPAPGSAAWMRWFRNLKCGVPFDADASQPPQSTDFSLQLADSIQNFRAWQSQSRALSASAYNHEPDATQVGKRLSTFKVRINGREQFKILRDVDD
jgi:hypothetical protein